ncbi:MAG: hypothetical protein LQ346_001627 [Caloplaca aetnensis]|nr:MAG: hypothetical protein LQ346_001627 [Caloplaca aetnensis]
MRLALQRLLRHERITTCPRAALRASDVVELNASQTRPAYQTQLRLRRASSSSVPTITRADPPAQLFQKDTGLVRKVWQKKGDDDGINFQLQSENQNNGTRMLPIKSIQRMTANDRERELWRLLGTDKHGKNVNIWLGLAQNRRDARGVKGITLIWRTLLKKKLDLPGSGRLVDELRNHFLDLGLADAGILKEILTYAREQKDLRDRTWPKLYATALSHFLRVEPGKAIPWHTRLYKQFPPSSEQFRQLLVLALHDEELRRLYLSMHQDFPQIHIYDFAIAQLCRHGLYAAAVKWHEKLIRRGDCPSDATKAEPILHYLWVHGEETQLRDYTRLMVEAGVSFAAYREKGVRVPSFISRDVVMPPLKTAEEIPKKKLSDEFCARLFATKIFSTDTVIASLVFLGAKEIGPQALREMAVRELDHHPYHEAIQDRLKQLDENGISVADSAFSLIVRRFASQAEEDLLRSVISCDLHSDTFEDEGLQESLLPCYQEQGDTVAFNRTITILTAKIPEQMAERRRWNYILRSCCSQRDLPLVTQTIEKMQELHILVESKSILHMRKNLLSIRRQGRLPLSTKDLDLIIRVWQSALRSGIFMPPIAWSEILRRLGMTGRLQAFEDLALWLAKWYSSQDFRESQTSMSGRKHRGEGGIHHPLMSVDLKTSHPHHPFQTLFPRSLQQGIVAWGFQRTDPSISLEQSERDWTWGISFLRTLRSTHDVHISTLDVKKALKIPLLALFGPGRKSRLKTNHAGFRFSAAIVDSFIQKAREIWGKDLITREEILSTLHRTKKVVPEGGRRVGGWTVPEDSNA